MEQLNGIWVKTRILRLPLKVAVYVSKHRLWQKIIHIVWNHMSRQMWAGLCLFDLTSAASFCWLTLPGLQMAPELLTCTGVFLCESKGGMQGGRSLKLIPLVHWPPLALNATEFRQTQNKGSNTSACKVRGGAAPWGEPELEQLLAPPLKRRRAPLSDDTWPLFFVVHLLSQLFPTVFPPFSCLLWHELPLPAPTHRKLLTR